MKRIHFQNSAQICKNHRQTKFDQRRRSYEFASLRDIMANRLHRPEGITARFTFSKPPAHSSAFIFVNALPRVVDTVVFPTAVTPTCPSLCYLKTNRARKKQSEVYQHDAMTYNHRLVKLNNFDDKRRNNLLVS